MEGEKGKLSSFDIPEIKRSITEEFSNIKMVEYLSETEQSVIFKGLFQFPGRVVPVAVKTYDRNKLMQQQNSEELDFETKLNRIKFEIQSLTVLNHPSIVHLIRASDLNKRFIHLVTEFCLGGDLAQGLRTNKCPYPESQVKIWFADLLEVFLELEQYQIVHRDVKPANLILKPDHTDHNPAKPTLQSGKIVLADFGICKWPGRGESLADVGTDVYKAPEIVIASERHNSKVDVWSLGVTIYVLLFGRDPWNRYDSLNNKTISQRGDDKAQYSGENLRFPGSPVISDGLKKVLKSMLVFEPINRIGWKEIQDDPYFLNADTDERSGTRRRIPVMLGFKGASRRAS